MSSRVLILGIGNLLWADEGFGVRVVERMAQWYEFPEHVRLLDGGTQGIYLLQDVREADVLVVFDAIDYGLPPGTIKCIEGEAVPKYMGAKKVSLHQTGFQEVLAMAEMMGDMPERLILIGVQPEDIEDYGGSLRPLIKRQIDPCIELALQYLEDMGVRPQRLPSPRQPDIQAEGSIADMNRYERERPSEQEACRIGDSRVLGSPCYEIRPKRMELENGLSVQLDHHLERYR